jgi:sarcosine oxidase gamma subunit
MLDRSPRWTPEPHWIDTRLRSGDCTIFPVLNLAQVIVSGNIAAGLAEMKIEEAARWGKAAADNPYVVGLGRTRVLVASSGVIAGSPSTSAWFEAGYAASDSSDGLAAFEIAGRGTFDLLAQMLAVDLKSARHVERGGGRMRLCEVPVIAYAHGNEDRARLHVERSQAAYVWQLLERLETSPMAGNRI